jgi:hypothetical protein
MALMKGDILMNANMWLEIFLHLVVIAIGVSALINSHGVANILKANTDWWEKRMPGRVIQLSLDSWVWLARVGGLIFIFGSLAGLIKKIMIKT